MAGRGDTNAVQTYFGRQVHKERLARGWSLDELSARTGIAGAHLSRIETGRRPPTEKIALACDAAFPERRGWFLEYYEESRTWTPPGLRSWAEYEDKAVRLDIWAPSIVHGLFQTEAYAERMVRTLPVSDEVVAVRVAARMERQRRVLYRDDPPTVCAIVDHAALYRRVGSAEIMAAQMGRLLDVAALPNVTLHVMPAIEHAATSSELIIADDTTVYAEHLAMGGVYTEGGTVTGLERLFASIRAESYRASESAGIIRKAGEIWTGESRVSAVRTDRA